MFPLAVTQDLKSLSRDQLLVLANGERPADDHSPSDLHALVGRDDTSSIKSQCFEKLEPSPNDDFGWNESPKDGLQGPNKPRIEDDVNGLSLVDGYAPSSSSYLGLTSIPAMIKVILKCCPSQQATIVPETRTRSLPLGLESGDERLQEDLSGWQRDEAAFTDAYFTYVHAVTPMVDEDEFRGLMATRADCGQESKESWPALMNMVLALGAIASTTASQSAHSIYYQRASSYIDLSCLSWGHIHTVQALALIGGYYLHYVNRPNMASAVMGAAIRVAIGMGLHLANHEPDPKRPNMSRARQKEVEIRIRTWWSVVCLDTWAGTTLGRPIVGSVENSLLSASSPTMRFSMVSLPQTMAT